MGLLDKLLRGTYKDDKKPPLFPKTRKEVFGQLFRYHKRTLFNVSLMCALFALPTLAVVLLSVVYKGYIPQFIADGSMTAPVADNAELSVLMLEMQIDRLACSVMIITNAILFLGLCGGVRVIRRAAWGENVEFFYDFGQGIKQNFKHYLLYAVIFGLSLLFCVFVIGYYSVADAPTAVKAISMAIAVLQLLTVAGTLVFALSHADVYKSSVGKELRNSFIFFISSFPINFGLLILTVLPLAALIIPNAIVQTIVSILMILLFPAFAVTVWVLRGDAVFDKYLNVGDNAEVNGKGIVWDDTDTNE